MKGEGIIKDQETLGCPGPSDIFGLIFDGLQLNNIKCFEPALVEEVMTSLGRRTTAILPTT